MPAVKKKAPSKTEKRIAEGRKIMWENMHRHTINLYSDELEIIQKISPHILEVACNIYALGFAKGMEYAQKEITPKKK